MKIYLIESVSVGFKGNVCSLHLSLQVCCIAQTVTAHVSRDQTTRCTASDLQLADIA